MFPCLLVDRAASTSASLPERSVGLLTSFLIPWVVGVERVAAYVASFNRDRVAVQLLDVSSLRIVAASALRSQLIKWWIGFAAGFDGEDVIDRGRRLDALILSETGLAERICCKLDLT